MLKVCLPHHAGQPLVHYLFKPKTFIAPGAMAVHNSLPSIVVQASS